MVSILRFDRAHLLGAALLAASATFASAGSASASTINDLSVSTCTTTNCSTDSIAGSITSHGGFSIPWVIQVGANGGECLRLATITTSSDLEMVAVSPSGLIFRDDDGGDGNLSLLKIAPAEAGWYTVQVARFNGSPTAENFVMRYGRYSAASNPNCAAPNAPTARAAAKK
jgi:hypothetical protein